MLDADCWTLLQIGSSINAATLRNVARTTQGGRSTKGQRHSVRALCGVSTLRVCVASFAMPVGERKRRCQQRSSCGLGGIHVGRAPVAGGTRSRYEGGTNRTGAGTSAEKRTDRQGGAEKRSLRTGGSREKRSVRTDRGQRDKRGGSKKEAYGQTGEQKEASDRQGSKKRRRTGGGRVSKHTGARNGRGKRR